MVNWGVIGCGGIAYRRTIPEGIIPAKNAQLVAVTDKDEKLAKEVGDKFKAKIYRSEDELLADTQVEAVYVATPVYLHAEQVIKSAEAGKHVLCEKSMAMMVEQCEQMIAVCEKKKVKLGIGYMMRFHTCHREAKKLVAEGKLGKIVFGRAQLSCWYPPMPGVWRQNVEQGGGGSLIDMGSHCIDLLEYIFDSRVTEVSCFTGNTVHSYPVEDTAVVVLRFANEAEGVVDNCFSIPDAASRNRLEIYGSQGGIFTEGTIGQGAEGDLYLYSEEAGKAYDAKQKRESTPSWQKIAMKQVNMYQGEIEHFSAAIEDNREPELSGSEGMWSQKVILACYESARKGCSVKV